MLGPGDKDGEVKPERGDDRGEKPTEEAAAIAAEYVRWDGKNVEGEAGQAAESASEAAEGEEEKK